MELKDVRGAVALSAWEWCAATGHYVAPDGWVLRYVKDKWVATHNGTEVMRDHFLSNVMMELCG